MAEDNKTYVKQYDLYTENLFNAIPDISMIGSYILCKVVQFHEVGNFCYISNEGFARMTNSSETTVKRQIKILIDNGLLISKSFYKDSLTGKTRLLSVPKNLDDRINYLIKQNIKQEPKVKNETPKAKTAQTLGLYDPIINNSKKINNNINMAQKMDTDQENHTDQKTNNFLKPNGFSDNSINFQDNFSDNSITNKFNNQMITSYHNSNQEKINFSKYDLSEDTDEVKTGESDQMSTSCHKLSLMKDFWNNLNIIRKYQYVIDNSKDTALYMAWVDKDNPKNNEEYTEEEINEMLEEIDNKKLIEELRKPIL